MSDKPLSLMGRIFGSGKKWQAKSPASVQFPTAL